MYTDIAPLEIDQGVILRDVYFYGLDKSYFGFVLTPTCDFAQNKVDSVHVCPLFSAVDLIKNLPKVAAKKISQSEIKDHIRSYINQRMPRYHWFAPLPQNTDPLIGDFQNITTFPVIQLDTYEIVTKVISPYREQIPARYVAYMGRIGTDDFSKNDITEWVDLVCSKLD